MLDDALRSELGRHRIDRSAHLHVWSEAIELLAIAESVVRSGGSNLVIKVDGGRAEHDIYTVVVSGGRLGEAFFRKDGAALSPLLRDALAFCLSRAAAECPGA